jgi:formate/nitrite transporter FocA (FNT family)
MESVRQKRDQTSPQQQEHRELERDHPLDEAQKSYHTVLEQQITQAEVELKRPALALLLSGLTAGLDLGFGPFAMAVHSTLTADVFSRPVQELINANLYAVGFIFVVLGRSALFTEHTTSGVLPVLAGRHSVADLARLWGLVLVANLAGCVLAAWFAVYLGPALQVVEPHVFGELARPMIDKSVGVTFASAVGAGWLMGLVSWMVIVGRDTTSQILFVWMTTFFIALFKMHHSVAGSIEVLMGWFAGQGVTGADYLRFVLLAVAGNAVGGALFVAALKFGSVHTSSQDE